MKFFISVLRAGDAILISNVSTLFQLGQKRLLSPKPLQKNTVKISFHVSVPVRYAFKHVILLSQSYIYKLSVYKNSLTMCYLKLLPTKTKDGLIIHKHIELYDLVII